MAGAVARRGPPRADAGLLRTHQPLRALRAGPRPSPGAGGRLMAARVPPKVMAKKLVRGLRPHHPDAHYLKKVFQHTRALLDIGAAPKAKRLPDLLTDAALLAFFNPIFPPPPPTHPRIPNLP